MNCMTFVKQGNKISLFFVQQFCGEQNYHEANICHSIYRNFYNYL